MGSCKEVVKGSDCYTVTDHLAIEQSKWVDKRLMYGGGGGVSRFYTALFLS